MRWQTRAACRNTGLDFFAPPTLRGGRPNPEHEKAKATCASCPVRIDCIEEGLADWDSAGIWGGTDEAERTEIRRLRGWERPPPGPDPFAPHRKPAPFGIDMCFEGLHEMDLDNAYEAPDGRTRCRACAREQRQEARERAKGTE